MYWVRSMPVEFDCQENAQNWSGHQEETWRESVCGAGIREKLGGRLFSLLCLSALLLPPGEKGGGDWDQTFQASQFIGACPAQW